MKKTVRAFACAPWVPCLLVAVSFWNGLALIVGPMVGYIGTALFGVPLYLLTRRYRRVSLPACMQGGALAGVLTFLTGAFWINQLEASLSFAAAACIFAVFGVVAGFSFWFIGGGLRKPDAALPP